jgi:hypothetical protein
MDTFSKCSIQLHPAPITPWIFVGQMNLGGWNSILSMSFTARGCIARRLSPSSARDAWIPWSLRDSVGRQISCFSANCVYEISSSSSDALADIKNLKPGYKLAYTHVAEKHGVNRCATTSSITHQLTTPPSLSTHTTSTIGMESGLTSQSG